MSETELKILSSVSTRMTFANVVLGIGLVHSTVERLYIYIYIHRKSRWREKSNGYAFNGTIMAIEYAGKSIRTFMIPSFFWMYLLNELLKILCPCGRIIILTCFEKRKIVNLSSLKILNASSFSISRNKIDFLSCSIIISFQRGTLDF